MTITWNHKPLAGSTPRHWETRKASECAFPFGEPANTLSCCLPVKGELPYCVGHHRVVYAKREL